MSQKRQFIITVSGVATNWGPITTVYNQTPYGLGNSHGPCPHGSSDSVTVTAVDSTGASASSSVNFVCVLSP